MLLPRLKKKPEDGAKVPVQPKVPVPDLVRFPFRFMTLLAFEVPEPKFMALAVILVTDKFPFIVTELKAVLLAASIFMAPVPLIVKSLVVKFPCTVVFDAEPTLINEPLLMVVFPVTLMALTKVAVAVLAIITVPVPLNVAVPLTVIVFAVALTATVKVPAPL